MMPPELKQHQEVLLLVFCLFWWGVRGLMNELLTPLYNLLSETLTSPELKKDMKRVLPDLSLSFLHCTFVCLLVCIYVSLSLFQSFEHTHTVYPFVICFAAYFASSYLIVDCIFLWISQDPLLWTLVFHHITCFFIEWAIFKHSDQPSSIVLAMLFSSLEFSSFLFHCSTFSMFVKRICFDVGRPIAALNHPQDVTRWVHTLSWTYITIRVVVNVLFAVWLWVYGSSCVYVLSGGVVGLMCFNAVACWKIYHSTNKVIQKHIQSVHSSTSHFKFE